MINTIAIMRYADYKHRYKTAIRESARARKLNHRGAAVRWMMIAALERGNLFHLAKRMKGHGGANHG